MEVLQWCVFHLALSMLVWFVQRWFRWRQHFAADLSWAHCVAGHCRGHKRPTTALKPFDQQAPRELRIPPFLATPRRHNNRRQRIKDYGTAQSESDTTAAERAKRPRAFSGELCCPPTTQKVLCFESPCCPDSHLIEKRRR